ncbi:hypothetical protein [Kitasatospora sp. NPDC097691]|uniref:hypothetical protein n=1 Tax=Kitasatospora sp. NPDC097691 TaxID=3157231 RepID=UPI0033241095
MFVDEAVAAAEGTRTTARWIASSLGAIPSLAVLASVVRAPGDAGFDPLKLTLGVALAAIGALVGVLGFARVLAPVPLEDADIRTLDVKRIPGQPYATFAELDRDLNLLRNNLADKEVEAAESRSAATAAESDAQHAEAAAAATGAAATGRAHRQGADKARADAVLKRTLATEQARKADADAVWLTVLTNQVSARDSIRRDAYRLKATDEVGSRYHQALIAAIASVAAIAAGVTLLGLAPEPKETVQLPALVTLTLDEAGQNALGCTARSLQALRTGGSASAPTVITLPTPNCPARTVVFTTVPPQRLGTVSVVGTDERP